ncbi:drug:h+ antiporter [Auriculariales sp. MPI-PUGE-AT-0066]|nr:drug:h+ antiporter [Auriculariales sp. MPI-PUGE-AT-0066]
MSDYGSQRGKDEHGDAVVTVHAVDTQAGVLQAEAVRRVWGPKSKIFLYLGIAITAYVYSLDGTTTYLYQAYATSDFQMHSSLSTIGVVNALVIALTKPIAAKLSDVIGRAQAFIVTVVLYTIGYIVVASSNKFTTYAGGNVLFTFGWAAIQIMLQIVIGDLTTLRWRSLISSLVSLPFFINAFVGSNIGAKVIASSTVGWRWGYGMFAIIIPITSAPIILTLLWGQHRAKKLGLLANDYRGTGETAVVAEHVPIGRRIFNFVIDVDLAGLILFGFGWGLILIPLTMARTEGKSWSSGDIIAMLTLGPIILIGFVFYEAKLAPKPLFPLNFFSNRTVMAAALIGFFDFISFYLQVSFQYSFIYITHSGWAMVDQNYFAYTQTLSLTFFGILFGVFAAVFRRAKWMLMAGLVIRLVAVGAMIQTKGAHGSTAGLVLTQVFQGMGGGIAAVAAQTLAQGSVPHQSLATVTAFTLLWAEIGNAIGSAMAGSIWKNTMPGQLHERLGPYLNSTEIEGIFASITTAVGYKGVNDAVFQGTVDAYSYVMTRLLIAATVVAILPIICAWFVKDIYLGDTQNAIEEEKHDDVPNHVEDLEKRDFEKRPQ